MFVKRVHHPLVFFCQGGPQRSAILPRGGTEPSETGRLFSTLRKKRRKERDVRQSIPVGRLFVCIYIYIFIHIYWTTTKNGARNFQVAVGKRLGDGRGSFEMRGV